MPWRIHQKEHLLAIQEQRHLHHLKRRKGQGNLSPEQQQNQAIDLLAQRPQLLETAEIHQNHRYAEPVHRVLQAYGYWWIRWKEKKHRSHYLAVHGREIASVSQQGKHQAFSQHDEEKPFQMKPPKHRLQPSDNKTVCLLPIPITFTPPF